MTFFRFLDHNTFFTRRVVLIHAVELQGPDSQHTEMIRSRELFRNNETKLSYLLYSN